MLAEVCRVSRVPERAWSAAHRLLDSYKRPPRRLSSSRTGPRALTVRLRPLGHIALGTSASAAVSMGAEMLRSR
jgi:hypothetical protein